MAVPREQPYIWTTWLPRLLTGENSCEWAVWFKAHHQNWAKVPSDFNQAEWMLNHTSLLNEKKSQWEARRQHVYVEGQNSFRLRGQSATLARQARPDRRAEQRRPDHRRQSWTAAAVALRTDHDLHVRTAQSFAAIPARKAGRRSGLSDADSTSTDGQSAHAVQNGPRSLDPPGSPRTSQPQGCPANTNAASATSPPRTDPVRVKTIEQPEEETTQDF